MNETYVLSELKALLNKYERLKDPSRHELETDIQLFELWMSEGKQGACPLNPEQWGIAAEPDVTTPETIETPPASSAPSAKPEPQAETEIAVQLAQEQPAGPELQGAPVEDAAVEETTTDSPAQTWLSEARQCAAEIENIDRLKEAVRLCDEVLNSPTETLHSEASQVRAQARGNLERLLEQALKEGQEAEKRNDGPAARAAYQRAQRIDSENEIARNALLNLDQKEYRALSRQEIINLRLGLAARDEMTRLEKAIRECEAQETGGLGLPDELKQLLPEARKYFNETREKDGQVITQARIGLLSESKQATVYFEDLRIKARKDMIDPLLGNRTIAQAVDEANRVWRQRSEEFVQATLLKIKPFLPARPRTAKGILERDRFEDLESGQRVPRPFQEDAAFKLEEKEKEIEQYLEKLERAENLAAQAEESDDPINVLALLHRARDAFEYLDGIDVRIENARQTALQHLLAGIEDVYANARTALKLLKFAEARIEVSKAEEIGARWITHPVPSELTEKLRTSDTLRESIDTLEKDKNDFDKIVADIRSYKDKEEKHPEAFRLLDGLVSEERFKVFAGDIRQLNIEMDSLRGVGDRLDTARLARSSGDWQRVLSIANENKTGAGLARELREQFEQLYLEADMELKIIEARGYIEKNDIPKANNLFSKLTHPSHPLREIAGQRLEREIALIKEVIQQNPPWNELFDTAQKEALKPGYEHQFIALHMLRYISGDSKEPMQKGWPEYRLSLRTADAGREAQHLAQRLRGTALKGVLEAYNTRQTLPGEAKIRHLAEIAAGLREAFLFEEREEREAAQWIEIEKAHLDHAEHARLGNWDAAVNLWEEMDRHYPRQAAVQSKLNEARIQQAILHADIALKGGKGQAALDILWQAQRDPMLVRSGELNLKLAEVYVDREEFVKAYEILDSLEASDTYTEKARQTKAKYEKEQQALEYLHRADDERKKERYSRAIEILLMDAPKNEQVKGDKRLVVLAAAIYTQRAEELAEMIDAQNRIGTYPAKVKALNAALELRGLENLKGIEKNDSRALQAIEDLRGELLQIALNLVQTVNRYNLEGMHLGSALEDTREAVQRLEAFESIKEQFKNELEEQLEPLRTALQQARTRLSNLTALEEQIEKSKSPALWDDSLTKGTFTTLDSIKNAIDHLNLPGLVEMEAFLSNLNEYKGLNKHFETACNQIQESFIAQEDFPKVIKLVKGLKSRPATYRLESDDKDMPFSQVSQGEYELAYGLVGENFIMVDLFSKDKTNLSSWQTILQTAEQRETDYQDWKIWSDTVHSQANQVQKRYEELKSKMDVNSMTLRAKLNEWDDLLSIIKPGLEAQEKFPHQSGTPLLIQSEKAEKERKAGLADIAALHEQKKWADTEIADTERRIAALGGFPSVEELIKLSELNDLLTLEKRIQQAEKIGAGSPEEERRIRMYKKKLEPGSAEPEKYGLIEWFRRWFQRWFSRE